ncbi:MAG: energy transducer TonB [Gloeomargaritaceae cyanobacterium C42_A2020_066]|nr:energy transducer TonB [Gloeomargaritaceae cyanobacterium C42_A2020_066]
MTSKSEPLVSSNPRYGLWALCFGVSAAINTTLVLGIDAWYVRRPPDVPLAKVIVLPDPPETPQPVEPPPRKRVEPDPPPKVERQAAAPEPRRPAATQPRWSELTPVSPPASAPAQSLPARTEAQFVPIAAQVASPTDSPPDPPQPVAAAPVQAALPTPVAPPAPPPKRDEGGKVACSSCPKPTYPATMRQQNVEGRVGLSVDVNPQGSVIAVSVRQSSGYPEFDEAAIQAVRNWTFTRSAQGRQGLAVSVRFELR